MFSVYDFGWMINDRVRSDAYIEALKRAGVRDKVVLDIGTGSGVFALLACRFGARKVYAIEPDDVIEVAKVCAAENGFAGRIDFIQAISTQVSLPEPADIIISDLRGILPLFRQHLPSIIDARERHLADGGLMIPQQDNLWAAVVESPEQYRNYTPLWIDGEYELDMSAARRYAVNTTSGYRAKAEDILLPPQCWSQLDYAQLSSPDVAGQVSWQVERPGVAHGLGIWFDTNLLNGIGFSNAPGQPELIYRQLFFPFNEAIELARGDQITVSIQASLTGGEYVWRWDTQVRDQNNGGKLKADYKQSSFYSAPLSPPLLRKKAADFVPSLKENGQADRLALTLMEDYLSLADIARRLQEAFPEQFADWESALAHAGNLSEKYSR